MIMIFYIATVTTEIYTLSLHDALPISPPPGFRAARRITRDDERTTPPPEVAGVVAGVGGVVDLPRPGRSEEHTSELQSHHDLVCRLLLEKKKIVDFIHSLSVFLFIDIS